MGLAQQEFKLRPYQQEDVDKLWQLNAAACFNEQRTGKTPTALGIVKKKQVSKVVIICPASAIYGWKEEYIKWLDKPCVAVAGTKQQKRKAIEEWEHGCVISYDSLKSTANSTGFIKEILKAKPDMVILDEAHRIKSRTTATASSCFTLSRKIPNKLVLTGTPAPGRAEDIWSILHFLFPKEYTSYWQWVYDFCSVTNKMNYSTGRQYTEINGIKPNKVSELNKCLTKFSTLRKRKDVMQWLPDKTYECIKLELNSKQKKYIKELEEYFEIEGTDVISKGILDNLIRMRQICNDPNILGLEGKSPKTDWLKQYVKDYPNAPTLVFSNFTSYLERLAKEIPSSRLIIGKTPVKERHQICKDFQNGKINLLLINIKAGKEALTLDRATTSIFTDVYPPIGDILQAEDRFVATTEASKDKGHKVVRLVMAGSYEENILKLLNSRKAETDVINDYKNFLQRRKKNGSTS